MVIVTIWPILIFIFLEWSLFPTSFPISMPSFLSDHILISIKTQGYSSSACLPGHFTFRSKASHFSQSFSKSSLFFCCCFFFNFYPLNHPSQLETTYQPPAHPDNPLVALEIIHHHLLYGQLS